MNLPDAIERARRLRSEALIRAGKWKRLDGEVSAAHALDAQALAVCIEALEVPRSTLKSAPPLTASEQVARVWGKCRGLFDGPRDENGIPEP